MCFDFVYNVCLKHFFVLRRVQPGTVINAHRSSCEMSVVIVRVSLQYVEKILKYRRINSVQWEPSCSMRIDGRRDITKPIVPSRNFAYAAKNGC
jgi:hypothetical protein